MATSTFTQEQARLEAIRAAITTRLSTGTFTRFPGNPKKAVTGVRWNMSGSRTMLIVYWQPVRDTFDQQPDFLYSIWRGSTEVDAWERYLGLTVPDTIEEARAELNAVPSYYSRKLGPGDDHFIMLFEDRPQPDPEQLLADMDAGC